jgi:hypothetical protein
MQVELSLDGYTNGPLFAHGNVRKAARCRARGLERWRCVVRRVPLWVDRADLRAIYLNSKSLTKATGVQHSVDHIVPLHHPLVCGLHCPANLCVIPLVENVHKSNNHWPDMWGEQLELL